MDRTQLGNSFKLRIDFLIMRSNSEYLDEVVRVVNSLREFDDTVDDVSSLISKTLLEDRYLYACGNGGSAADAQHLVAEISVRFLRDRRPFRAVALTTNYSALTAIGNDYCFEDIYKRELQAFGNEEDVLIGITTSGNSENIVRPVEYANANGIATVGLLGKDGGRMKGMCDYEFIVDSRDTGIIQIGHATLYNRICELVDKELMKHG